MIGGQKQVAALLKLYFPYLQCWQQGMGCKIIAPSIWLTVCPSVSLSIYSMSFCISVHLSVCSSICLSVRLYVVDTSFRQSVCQSFSLSVWKISLTAWMKYLFLKIKLLIGPGILQLFRRRSHPPSQ